MVVNGWKNKTGTAAEACSCGTWKKHWVNFSEQPWPTDCSVRGCPAFPILGAHIQYSPFASVKIVPMCNACSCLEGTFSLNGGATLVSANKAETCEMQRNSIKNNRESKNYCQLY